ncbi:MAG: hypothetical protein ACPGR2_16860 [Psychrobium sp.]
MNKLNHVFYWHKKATFALSNCRFLKEELFKLAIMKLIVKKSTYLIACISVTINPHQSEN